MTFRVTFLFAFQSPFREPPRSAVREMNLRKHFQPNVTFTASTTAAQRTTTFSDTKSQINSSKLYFDPIKLISIKLFAALGWDENKNVILIVTIGSVRKAHTWCVCGVWSRQLYGQENAKKVVFYTLSADVHIKSSSHDEMREGRDSE